MMQIPGDIKGKTALITGSTSGIGLGIASALAEAGANIVMNGLENKTDIAEEIAHIEDRGVKVLYSQTDVSKGGQIEKMVREAEEEFGAMDIIVNNAGIQFVAPIEEFPPEKWEAIIAINQVSAYHTVHHALPKMKEKGWGRIINIASAHGLVASPYKSAYVAAKHGILGFTKSVALEVAEKGITCNAICPGYVRTPLVENQIEDTMKARNLNRDEVINDVMLKAQWTKKFVTIEQVAGIAKFLCSDVAENITGADIKVDGGWTAA